MQGKSQVNLPSVANIINAKVYEFVCMFVTQSDRDENWNRGRL